MGSKLPPNEMELYKRVDEVLHYIWDPIGVAGVPDARDEYYSYVPQVFALVKNGADARQVSEYLHNIANNHIGVNSEREHANEIANILFNWRDLIAAKNP